MKNGLFSMLSELPFDHVITMHVDAMDQAEAVQEIEKKLAYMHKEEYDAIAKARERNMPASIAVSYDLKSKMHHTEQMMDDITTKNQKIFKVCILIHTYGDSNAQLDERVRRICSTVQQQTCRLLSLRNSGLKMILSQSYFSRTEAVKPTGIVDLMTIMASGLY